MNPCVSQKLLTLQVAVSLYMTSWMPFGKAAGQCESGSSIFGKALKGHTFETFNASCPSECDIRCENEPRCQSYNYLMEENVCELNNRSKESRPENYVTDLSRIYMTQQFNRVPLGSTRDMPAVSCEEVKASEGEAALCKNWVKPNSSAEAAVMNCYLETKVYRIIFPKVSDGDYALIENAIKDDLSAFTLCLFMKMTPDADREQTVFSYAADASHMGNGIYVAPLSPTIEIDINNEDRESKNGKIEDVNWHHICVTWDNTEGNYQLYIDGQLTDSGGNLMKGHVIPRGGTAVLGQDQDSVGGGFDTKDAFGPGQLTEVNMWNKVLSGHEIAAQSEDCHIPPGSVFAWSQFKNASYGSLQVYEP